MKEYWVNVYGSGKMIDYASPQQARFEGYLKRNGECAIYRIHVKMKEPMKVLGVEIPGLYAGDGRLKEVKPKYEYDMNDPELKAFRHANRMRI